MRDQYLIKVKLTRKRAVLIGTALLAGILFWPSGPIFPDDYSRVVTDRYGSILRVTLASDGQFRFAAESEKLPDKYIKAVTVMEDRRFFYHPGIDPFSIINSFICNIRTGKRVRGASTIPMQVARLSGSRSRTYLNKAVECIIALRLSVQKSKMDILRLYANHAPMGGNITGIWSASRYYFGKPLEEITWAEAALFAVLPNNPLMINIRRQRSKLKSKRDNLIKTLYRQSVIDSITCELSVGEQLPLSGRIPFEAPHFSELALRSTNEDLIYTTLDKKKQKDVETIINRYTRNYRDYGVVNMAALVIDNSTCEVVAYIGSQGYEDTLNSGRVDGVKALRSSGSLLKPLLVARAFDRGPWLNESRIQDVPTYYGAFSPSNANEDFQGVVTIEQMLVQSLNVPAVRLLYDYGQSDFYHDLKQIGVSTLFRDAEGYGLSIILGGAEITLWEMSQIYCGFSNEGLISPLKIFKGNMGKGDSIRMCSPGSSWLVLSSLSKLNRPENERYGHLFSGQIPVAWKTGTSYGQKDAWAIGVNKQWTIGIWVGNFTGEGNQFLGGAVSAGPVMFALFQQLTDNTKPVWFERPEYDLKRIDVCSATGYLPGPSCLQTTTVLQPSGAWKTLQCPWHRKMIIDRKSGNEICSKCWKGIEQKDTVFLAYPSAAAEIIRKKGFTINNIPPHLNSCTAVLNRRNSINIEYPVNGITILIPHGIDQESQQVVCKASSLIESPLFWYLDGKIIGETVDFHNVAVNCSSGKHILSVFDNDGGEGKVSFSVASGNREIKSEE